MYLLFALYNNMLARTNKIRKSSNTSRNKPTNWYFIIDYYWFFTMGDMTKKPINVIMTRKIFLKRKSFTILQGTLQRK